MTNTFTVQAKTALSPEWDHGFDEAFTDLVTAEPDWVRDEFDALIGANFTEPPDPPPPPAPSTGQPEPPSSPPGSGQTRPAATTDQVPADPVTTQRSPP
ncbi:hypothetical protein [Actinoplanes sp. NPDC026619]|uniref:hypothetical protein n=1 Tax=Actinoplanes sp. NPDC026619 TaxID=3155798 RepID=UPI0033C10382